MTPSVEQTLTLVIVFTDIARRQEIPLEISIAESVRIN